jgi:hypothetical protein
VAPKFETLCVILLVPKSYPPGLEKGWPTINAACTCASNIISDSSPVKKPSWRDISMTESLSLFAHAMTYIIVARCFSKITNMYNNWLIHSGTRKMHSFWHNIEVLQLYICKGTPTCKYKYTYDPAPIILRSVSGPKEQQIYVISQFLDAQGKDDFEQGESERIPFGDNH